MSLFYYGHDAAAPYEVDRRGFRNEELDADRESSSLGWAHKVGLVGTDRSKIDAVIDRVCAYANGLPGADHNGIWVVYLSWQSLFRKRYDDLVFRHGTERDDTSRRMAFTSFDDASRGAEKIVAFLESSGSADAMLELLAREVK